VGRIVLIGQHTVWDGEPRGSSGEGTVFSLSFRPQLTITASGTNIILSWPPMSPVRLHRLHFAIHHQPGFTCGSGAPIHPRRSSSPAKSTVTNPIIGAQKVLRLVQ